MCWTETRKNVSEGLNIEQSIWAQNMSIPRKRPTIAEPYIYSLWLKRWPLTTFKCSFPIHDDICKFNWFIKHSMKGHNIIGVGAHINTLSVLIN